MAASEEMGTEDCEMLILSPVGLAGPGLGVSELGISERGNLAALDWVWAGLEEVTSPHGVVTVWRGGNLAGPALITFHDIGLDHATNYGKFFNSQAMSAVASHFCIYHLNAPKPAATSSSVDIDAPEYPSLEQLSEAVEYICHHYGLSSLVGMGTGLGANVLVRLAHRRPRLVEGLVLINGDCGTAGWLEWGQHKVNLASLGRAGTSVPPATADYLVWHHFGSMGGERGAATARLCELYRQYFLAAPTAQLAGMLSSLAGRTAVKLARDISSAGKTLHGGSRTLKMPVLNIVGEHSPHLDSTVRLNGRLDPARCTWMKIREAGCVLEEQPDKVAEATVLFLRGLGYNLKRNKIQSS